MAHGALQQEHALAVQRIHDLHLLVLRQRFEELHKLVLRIRCAELEHQVRFVRGNQRENLRLAEERGYRLKLRPDEELAAGELRISPKTP